MKEDESIHDFYMNILDIANTSSALGEKMCWNKMFNIATLSFDDNKVLKVQLDMLIFV